jgi:hypothetical protein
LAVAYVSGLSFLVIMNAKLIRELVQVEPFLDFQLPFDVLFAIKQWNFIDENPAEIFFFQTSRP